MTRPLPGRHTPPLDAEARPGLLCVGCAHDDGFGQVGAMKASVWVGTVDDAERLEAVLVADASCHGDSLGSDFSRAIAAPAVADAVRETRLLPAATTSAAALVRDVSFASALTAGLPAALPRPSNALVVFYGVETPGEAFEAPGVRLVRLGVVTVLAR
jgi:hypothetical protein